MDAYKDFSFSNILICTRSSKHIFVIYYLFGLITKNKFKKCIYILI